MKQVAMVHSRPHENDCYDDFVKWLKKLGLPVRWVRWNKFRRVRGERGRQENVFCAMQDPVGKKKASVLPVDCWNKPSEMSIREHTYEAWRAAGIPCPDLVTAYSYRRVLGMLAHGETVLLKDTATQMGRAYIIKDRKRLDWVHDKAKRFKQDRFKIVRFVDVAWDDGYSRLHRYLATPECAIPLALAKCPGWSAKASHMKCKQWSKRQWTAFLLEWREFYNDMDVPVKVMDAVRASGFDIALVDTSILEDGSQIFWEVNPMLNLRPAEVAGKRERWWPFVANFLFPGADIPERGLKLSTVKKTFMEFEGYKVHWTKLKKSLIVFCDRLVRVDRTV